MENRCNFSIINLQLLANFVIIGMLKNDLGCDVMGRLIYFTGGARSGKSEQAEKYIEARDYTKKIYIATAIPFDEEMKLRVAKHKEQRRGKWLTIEAYKDLIPKIEEHYESGGVILLDCLTNMVTNLMIMEKEYDWDHLTNDEFLELEKGIIEKTVELFDYLEGIDMDTVIVSNELGMGVVPAYPLGRYFRDICGRINKIAAKYSKEAYFMVSGISMKIK